MSEQQKVFCPECDAPESVDRRHFLTVLGGSAVTLASLEAVPKVIAQETTARPAQPRAAKPAEALVRELYGTLTEQQRTRVVYPWNHVIRANNNPTNTETRLRMFNAAIFNDHTIGGVYTAAQQDLNQRILRAICSDEEGHRRITRNGTFDGSGSFGRCGAYIFGDPTGANQFSWVFAGHHLTVRCDGNSQTDTAFGGPMYYGHSPDGYSQRNVFNYQTRSVMAVYQARNEQQRRQATIATNPGELAASVRHRAAPYPGIAGRDLTPDQRNLVQTAMRDILSPYRREDADEVMEIARRNGGMERIHLGFFKPAGAEDWTFWRLEGPGFVWNYRVLEHVHCYVNIARVPAST
jgi:hypothetical protein